MDRRLTPAGDAGSSPCTMAAFAELGCEVLRGRGFGLTGLLARTLPALSRY